MTPEFIAWLKDRSAIRTVLIEVVAQVSGVETTFYLSTKAAYTTGAADTPALTTYRAGASVGRLFTERLSLDGTAAGLSTGEIEVANFNGERDAWLGYVWTNGRIRAWLGDQRWLRAPFEPIFVGAVTDIAPKGRNALALKLKDTFQRLNAPVTEAKMGGTGPNADVLRLLPLGEVHNITPRVKGTGYEYSGFGAERVIEARVEGKPRDITDDPVTGSFALTTAIGPGAITCDVQGVKLGGVYVNTIATLVEYVVTQCGKPSDRFTTADLDTANLAAFDTAHPQAVGHLVSDRENVIAVCQHLAGSVGAQIVPTRLGLLRLIQLAMPGASTFDIRPKHIKAGTLVPTSRTEPIGAVKLGFGRSFTQQTGMQTSINEDHREMYGTEWSTTTKTDAAVIAARKLTAEPVMQPTALIDKTEAETEAQRRLDLWKIPRQCYEFDGEPELLQLELGQAVTVYSALHGMDSGVLATIISLAPDWATGSVKVGFIAWQ